MNFVEVISSIPSGIYVILAAIVTFLLYRSKNKAEVDNIIGKSYYDLLNAYKDDREMMSKEMETLRVQQIKYMENSTELIKQNSVLGKEIKQLQRDHSNCHLKNQQLQKEFNQIKKKLAENGI